MGEPVKKLDEHYTFADYKTWPDDERWELIDGVAWDMSPAPTRKHQDIFTNIFREFSNYLKDKECSLYGAPFDVRLPDDLHTVDSVDTVVQPDISIFCDDEKLDDQGAIGVREYWIVDPANETLTVYMPDKS